MANYTSITPKQRMNITYSPAGFPEEEVELPCILLVIGDFIGERRQEYFIQRPWISIEGGTLERAISKLSPRLKFSVRNLLNLKSGSKDDLSIEIRIRNMDSFHPYQVAEQIPELKEILNLRKTLTHITGQVHELPELESCLQQVLPQFEKYASPKDLISQIDEVLGCQLDEVLHHPEFQRLEANWRGLQLLVEQTDFRENIEIFLWNVSKEDLSNDLNNTEDVNQSFFSQKINNEYNGMPYPFSVIIAAYEFGPSAEEINLLDRIASVAESAAVPFIAGAKLDFFCKENDFQQFSYKQIDSLFNDPKYIKWNHFRDTEAARFIGLTFPRFRVRPPYKLDNFAGHLLSYKEHVGDDPTKYLWCNSAFALASRLVDSFAKYRHCANIIGAEDGLVEIPFNPRNRADEEEVRKRTEILLFDEVTEYQLSKEGFIPLLNWKGEYGKLYFWSASSCQRPRKFEDKNVNWSSHFGAQLPYLFFILRFYQYLSILQREMKGICKTSEELETGLNRWLYRYQDDPSKGEPDIPIIHEPKPLSRGQVKMIVETPENPDRYTGYLTITPKWKYMGDWFNLYFRFFWRRKA